MLSGVKLQLDDLSSRQEAFLEGIDPRRGATFLDFYIRLIPRMLDAERCSVFIHDPENRKVWLKTGTGVTERGIEVSLNGSIVGDVIASGKPVIAMDLVSRDGAHRAIDTTTGFITREVICVPIRSKDQTKVTGAIEALNKKSGGKFNQEDQAFLGEVGEHIQSVVESIFLGQEALGMSKKLVTIARQAIIGAVMAVGASVFVFSLIYMALLSRFE
ncbi:MAG: GAF domain-containing protein [Betaproteobacteria bacterium]|nr:GAF domain-containing protein [Betaproteobacteria bacterium]